MTRHQYFLFSSLGAVLLLSVTTATPAHAVDKIVRGGLGYVVPSDELEWGGPAQMDFMDPRFPPSGRFDSVEEHRTRADGGVGLGIGLELRLTELFGIDTHFNFSRHDTTTEFAGEITFTPAFGDPPALNPDHNEVAPIIGTAPGEASVFTFTVAANFHVLRMKAVDIYVGPVVGLAVVRSELISGGFTASFPSFVSATPVESVDWKQLDHVNLVGGGAFGVDIPFGSERWSLSMATKYLLGGVDPWSLQLGLGYRF